MTLAHALARLLARHATLLMALSVLVGIAWQDLARLLAPWVAAASVGTMYLSCVRLDERVLKARLGRPALPIALVAWTTLVLPAIVFVVLRFVPITPELAAALLLIAATSPIVSVAAYCVFLGTDAELLMLAVLPAAVVSIASLPAFAGLVGIEGLAPGVLVLRLLGMIGTSLLLAAATRAFVTRARIEREAVWLDAIMVVFIVIVALGVSSGLREVILTRPAVVIEYFLATLAFNAMLQAASWLVFARCGPRVAASAALVGGCRNMAVLLAVVLGLVGPEIQLVLVMAQLQLFILPALMRPVYAALGVSARATSSS
jgi:predicted Na+-dependent transporter